MDTHFRLLLAALLIGAAIWILLPLLRPIISAAWPAPRRSLEQPADTSAPIADGATGSVESAPPSLPMLLTRPRFRRRRRGWWVRALIQVFADARARSSEGQAGRPVLPRLDGWAALLLGCTFTALGLLQPTASSEAIPSPPGRS